MLPAGELLRERLREALGPRRAPPAPALRVPSRPVVALPEGQEVHHLLPGFWQDTPSGRVFVIERRFELEHRHGRLPLGHGLTSPTHLWARIGRTPELAGVDPRRVVFLDTETTGLAGGAGTIPFLVGIGHFLDGHFRLRQYFLSDLAQEAAMLRALIDYLDDFEAVVTFNGKTFDLPLIETRLVLARMRRRLTDLPHLDLLHPARRIYRDRLASCRLGMLETRLLGLERHEDVPGHEIPAIYFRFLRTRRFRALLPVFEHNALDVLSLVTLTVHLARLFGGELSLSAGDRLALGRSCEGEGRLEEALTHYEAALALDLAEGERSECEKRLSLLLKRLGRLEEAAELWSAIAGRDGNRELYPLVELAMYHERTTRDLQRAYLLTERALLLLEGYHARRGYPNLAAERAALHRRRLRLEERIARADMRQRATKGQKTPSRRVVASSQ